MQRDEAMNPSLNALLNEEPEAYEFYESLHPSVKMKISDEDISTGEELAARANEAMSDVLMEFGGIFDDSDSWPNDAEGNRGEEDWI